MKVNRNKIIKCVIIFLSVMVLFTIISNKINYMMMPEVQAVSPGRAELSYEISAFAYVADKKVIFALSMEKEPYISVGDHINAEFSNLRERLGLVAEEKNFDPMSQSMEIVCRFDAGFPDGVYEGQNCQIRHSYSLGSYECVVPREAVLYEGGRAYLYRVETVKSVMGESSIVRKLEVEVLDEDDFNAAVSGGVNNHDLIVRRATKPLRNNQKVRLT